MLGMLRRTKSSPGPASRMRLGTTRESQQAMTIACGRWPRASASNSSRSCSKYWERNLRWPCRSLVTIGSKGTMKGMDIEAFRRELAAEGYDEVVERRWDPGAVAPVHRHPFTAKAIVTAGRMTITCGGATQEYGVGDVFFIEAETPHEETYGPEGATYLVGRKLTTNSYRNEEMPGRQDARRARARTPVTGS